jgi:thioredoxin-like negative regulator of GroEL
VIDFLSFFLLAVKFVKINTVNSEDLAAQQGIESLPTLLFFKSGKRIGDYRGSEVSRLEAAIRSYVK